MGIIIISIVAFLAAILTFFSGFGLGTILTPVFMIFFPVEVAIALTGVVHFCNNIFKLLLVGKYANKEVVINFGIPAILSAILGSWCLISIENFEPLFSYYAFGKYIEVFPVKFIISVLLIIFACIDLIPYFKKLEFDKNKMSIGGILSGFFGGLSGNQGALRSAFLLRAGLSKEAFVATAVVVSTLVDLTRLSIYSSVFYYGGISENMLLLVCATLAAIAGAFIGNMLLKKVTLKFLQVIVALMLIIISLTLGMGLI